MQTCLLSFDCNSTIADLKLIVRLDGCVIFNDPLPTVPSTVTHEFQDDESEHVLEFEMQGKTSNHTVINDAGEILQDHTITIKNVSFDNIPLGHVFTELSEYHHDFNGTKFPVVEKFYGTAGCNGIVKLEFKTPIYLWLLENM
jgi:hypothetical protein